jgi:hypothetical protein
MMEYIFRPFTNEYLIVLISFFVFGHLKAQDPDLVRKFGLPIVKDYNLIGTKWKYAYTLQVESKTVVHKADDNYQYFLYFKYDFTYEQFLNGKFEKGDWVLSGNSLKYKFKNTEIFEVAEYDNGHLALEFKQTNSTGTHQYHFISVESKNAPFVRAPNELPEVTILETKKKNRRPWWSIFGQSETAKAKEEQEYLNVELIGGGFYGGIDPVLKDYVKINNEGSLIKEFQSSNQPLTVTKKHIPREELEKFIAYVVEQNFFDFKRMYDCESAICEKRKFSKPSPIPLRISITKGNRKKVVTVAIWGLERNKIKYVDYPQALDYIIDAIQRMSNRIEG